MKYWVFLALAILSEVSGTSALKLSQGFSRLWPTVLVVICFGLCFYFLSLALRTIPIGIAYAIWAGVGIVFVSLIGWLAFHQALDAPALVGIALIIAGVVVIRIGSNTATG
jgi:small multidrug resistance pump